MDEPVLKIPAKRYGGDSAVVSVRLPKDMLRELDQAAQAAGRTRNEIMSLALEFALEHMEVTNQKIEEEPEA